MLATMRRERPRVGRRQRGFSYSHSPSGVGRSNFVGRCQIQKQILFCVAVQRRKRATPSWQPVIALV
jgi:hypothetical protein